MEIWSQDVLHVYAENEPAVRRNEVVRNGLPGDIYKIEAVEIPENCQYSLVKNQAGQTQNRTNRGCLVNLP